MIVPIYNSEKYLVACLESIINQTYRNLEIILIDDGSTDSSGNICDRYAEKDGRIIALHKNNGGIGSARNEGLEYANGEWIVQVDSDDVINNFQIEILLTVAKTKNLDMAVGWYKNIAEDEAINEDNIDYRTLENVEVLTNRHLYDDAFIKKYSMIFTVPWCKICKKKLYEEVRYPMLRRNVDTWTTWKLYEKTNKVGFIPIILYYWRNNPSSITRKFELLNYTALNAYREQLEYFWLAKKQRYVEIVYSEYNESFFWCYNRIKEQSMDLSELKPYWKYMRKSVKYIKLTRSMGLYMWMKYRYLVYYRIPRLIK